MRAAILTVVLLASLTACQTTKSSHCTAFEATPPSNAQIDAMTPDEKARALTELLKFERICGARL